MLGTEDPKSLPTKSSQLEGRRKQPITTWCDQCYAYDMTYKSYDITVIKYWCENWTIKKTECQRIDPFELWYSRRLLRVPWTARRSNQSILILVNPNIQHWIFIGRTDVQAPVLWPPDVKSRLIGKGPVAGKDWGEEEKGDEMVR